MKGVATGRDVEGNPSIALLIVNGTLPNYCAKGRSKVYLAKIIAVILMVVALAQAERPHLTRYEYSQTHMGTQVKIVLYCASGKQADRAAVAAFQKIARLDATMSDYNQASELNRLCRRSARRWARVSADLFRVLLVSQQISRQTEGAFDVTVGPVVKLWRRARRTGELPDRKRLSQAQALTGFTKIRLSAKTRSVRLSEEGMQLDLGAVAKGYAADEAMRVLNHHRISRALVAIGGDIRAGSPPPGRAGWKIEIRGAAKDEGFIIIRDCGVSTSGDLEQFVEIGGIRYSHIVNPKTGIGVIGPMSATVVAPSATFSDALATALCVMEPERGLRLIASRSHTAALIYRDRGKGIECFESKRWADIRQSGLPAPIKQLKEGEQIRHE